MRRLSHAADCKRFPFEQIPRRVFLDTNVINCLVKWSDCIFEQQDVPSCVTAEDASQIEALRLTFLVGSRANWDVVASQKTIDELSATPHPELRDNLLEYGVALLEYGSSQGRTEDDHRYARDLTRRLIDSPFLAALPHKADRELVSHAVALGCDVFCTLDVRSIYRKRTQIRQLPLRILKPSEWWEHIAPWAGLWT